MFGFLKEVEEVMVGGAYEIRLKGLCKVDS